MRRNSFNTSSNPAREIGIFKGSVVSVGEDGLLRLKIPKLGLNNIYEGIPYAGPTPAAGDVVFVGFLEGKSGSFVAFTGVVDAGNTGEPAGDITSIVAGTNLNGGGSGGAVTLNLDSAITLTTVNANLVGNVTGNVTGDLTGNVTGNQSGGSISATTLTTSGDATVGGDLTVNGTTVTLNTETLTVEDNIIVLNSNVTGTPSLDAGIEVERGSETNVSFLWDESADAWSIGAVNATGTVTATALAVTGEFTLPTADGTADQVLVTDGSGSVTWQDNEETTPGGSDGFVQYNNGSAFGGASSLYYDDVNNRVGIGTSTPVAGLHLEGFGDVSNASTGHYLQLGATSGANIRIDNNEINAVNNGAAGTLYLQNDGGTLNIGNNTATNTTSKGHFTAQSGGADGGIVLGQTYNSGYVGLRTAGMAEASGSEYLVMSDGSTTFISAAANGDVYIRGGANNSSCQIVLDTSANDIDMTGDVTVTGNVGIGNLTPSFTLDVSGSARITGDLYADDLTATTGVFYGGGSDGAQPNEYMQFSESGNYWRVVNDGGEDFRVDSSGYAYTAGLRYYFGIASNDYVEFEDTTNSFAFYSDGSQVGVVNFNNAGNYLIPAGAGYMGADTGSQYPTGSGTDARIITGFGVSTLVKSSSVRAEKENISTDLGTHLTVGMVDSIVPKMWNRIIAPGYPEIGPIAEDMDAISPFLSTAGTDADGEHLLMGVNSQTWMSLLTLAIQDLRARVAALEPQ